MKNLKYQKYKDNKYAYSKDIQKKLTPQQLEDKDLSSKDKYSKTFGGYDNYNNFEKFCSRNKNIYQLINKQITKFYFDFDASDFKNNENCKEEELEDIVKILIASIKDFFNETIERNNIMIETDSNYPYKSIHIIINNYMVDRNDIKSMNNFLINTNKFSVDNSVYSKYRQFRLLGMKKINKDETNILINHKSNYYKDLKSHLICETENCKLLNIDETKTNDNTKTISLSKTKTISKNDVKKSKDNQHIDFIDTTLVYDLINNLNDNFYNSKSWIKITKIMIRDLEAETPQNKMECINYFLEHSANKSNGNYTYEDNLKFYNTIDLKSISYMTINSFCKIANNYLDYNLVSTQYLSLETIMTDDIINYIVKHSGIEKYKIKLEIETTDVNEKTTFIYFSNSVKYDVKQQLLFIDKKLYNYNEIEYEKRIEKLDYEITYDKVIDNVNNMKYYNDDFLESNLSGTIIKKTLIYKAKWGTGKSFYGMTEIIKQLEANKSILIITENNSLNSQLYTKYKQYGFSTHQQQNYLQSNRIIVSLESSININKYDYDLVILDEFETILCHYESEDTLNNINYNKLGIKKDEIIYHNYLNLKNIIKNCDKLLVMDADISKSRIEWLKQIRPSTTFKKSISKINDLDNVNYKTIYIDINNFNDYKFNHYIKLDLFKQKLQEDFNANKKIIFSSNSKRIVNEYYKALTILNSNRNSNHKVILKLTGDGADIDIKVKLDDGSFVSKKYNDKIGNHLDNNSLKELVLKDIEKFIIENKVDILLYTPTIKTGISIDSEYFNTHYSYGKSGSVNCRTYIQMLFRARKLIDKEFNIYIEGSMKLNKYIDKDRMGNVFLNISSNYTSKKYKNGIFNVNEDDKIKMKLDHHYYNLKINNKVENFNSNINFNSDFITKIKIIHKLNHKYINTFKNDETFQKSLDKTNDLDKNDVKNVSVVTSLHKILMESKQILKEERIELMVHTKLINKNEYDIIKEKIEANKNTTLKTAISIEEYNSYYKFNYLFGYYFFCKSSLKNTYYFKKLEPLYNYLVNDETEAKHTEAKHTKNNDDKTNDNIFDEYNILNTYMFYELWDNLEQKKRYKNAYLLLNNNIEYDKETNTFEKRKIYGFSNDVSNVLNINKLNREDIRLEFIIELLKIINISDIRKNYYYTNKELLKILFNKFDDLIKLDIDYNNRLTELNIQIIKNNDYRNDNDLDDTEIVMKKYKNIIQYLNKWFSLVNLKIKYLDDNTTKTYGKLKIGFNEKYKYNTFENDMKNDMKNDETKNLKIFKSLNKTNVKKYKKGYVDENNRPVYKYITTKFSIDDTKNTSEADTSEADTSEADTSEADKYYKNGFNEVYRYYKLNLSKKIKKLSSQKDIDFSFSKSNLQSEIELYIIIKYNPYLKKQDIEVINYEKL